MQEQQQQPAQTGDDLGRPLTAHERQVEAIEQIANTLASIDKAVHSLIQRMDERSEAETVLREKKAKHAQSQAKSVAKKRKGQNKAEADAIHPVTYEELCEIARKWYGCTDEAFLREVFDTWSAGGWRDRNNRPFNPGLWLGHWIKFRGKMDALADPERVPDARKQGRRPSRADNWRGTKPEDLEDVF